MGGSYAFWLASAPGGAEADPEWMELTVLAFQRPRSVILRDLDAWRASFADAEARMAAKAAGEEAP